MGTYVRMIILPPIRSIMTPWDAAASLPNQSTTRRTTQEENDNHPINRWLRAIGLQRKLETNDYRTDPFFLPPPSSGSVVSFGGQGQPSNVEIVPQTPEEAEELEWAQSVAKKRLEAAEEEARQQQTDEELQRIISAPPKPSQELGGLQPPPAYQQAAQSPPQASGGALRQVRGPYQGPPEPVMTKVLQQQQGILARARGGPGVFSRFFRDGGR
ncbi:hypothetical protein [Methylorubrum extorquens]|uniref:hypothetical protein n=1 Tax=Methylorubrum extorquens TaxID=408 RepID=UPI0012DB0FF0|nr:hypothetical protein [Methylorubrum extorquens]